MDQVTVNKTELISKLKTNREKQVQLYKDAMEGYFVDTEKKLKAALTKIGNSKTITGLSFTIPIDHTKQYDEAILLLEMSVDKEIELQRHEFKQYVLDDWISASEKELLRGYAMLSSNSVNYAGIE